MKLIKIAGIAWSLIYFVIGAIFSFTLGSNEFWSGAVVYLTLFLLPLPISFVALWFPRIAAAALISSVFVSICVSAVSVFASGPAPDLPGLCKFALLHIPHLCFAALYTKLAQSSRGAYAEDRPSDLFQR
jgi:ABC-type multidrug transport system permease subunit